MKLLALLKPYRLLIAAALVLAFFQSLATLYLPTLLADIVDNGVVTGDTRYIIRVGGVMLLITLGGALCAVAGSFVAAKIALGFGRLLRKTIFAKVEGFSLHEFNTFSTASL